MFNIEEKAFLKQLGIKNRKAIIDKINEIVVDDDFSKEFLNDLLKKLEKSKDNTINF